MAGLFGRLARGVRALKDQSAYSPEYRELHRRVAAAKRVIDLGCGARPHARAMVGVDRYLEPEHRNLGTGPRLDASTFRGSGAAFVQADLTDLPFADRSFDFAYSHHVFEHLPDPKKACLEMQRVARAGVIITPSGFGELAFGRPYHLWLVIPRGNTLLFVRKMAVEDRPFGESPVLTDSGPVESINTNPFDILLNDGGWYKGPDPMPKLSRLLRRYYYTHSRVIETTFLWEGSFNCLVMDENGRLS